MAKSDSTAKSSSKKDDTTDVSNTDPNQDVSSDLDNATTNLSSGDANQNVPVTSANIGETTDTEGQDPTA
jgi:hypothetical protein